MVFIKRSLEDIMGKLGNINFKLKGDYVPFRYGRVSKFDRDWIDPIRQEIWGKIKGVFPYDFEYWKRIGFALENACEHGHKLDGEIPIGVEHFGGDRGYLIIVSDQGEGFDYKSRINQFREGARYSTNLTGSGFKFYNNINVFSLKEEITKPDWEVTFLDRGNRVAFFVPRQVGD